MATNALDNFERLGNVFLSPGTRLLISQPDLLKAITRHLCAASDGCAQRRVIRRNNRECPRGCRLLSLHRTSKRQKFLVITEADQSRTSVILPTEF